MNNLEQRFLNAVDYKAELRIEQRADKPSLIIGYPAKFNKKSLNLGGFREQILPGAFTRTLAADADVRGLVNHNPDLVLGRSKSGTLRLREDGVGLRMEIDAPDTQVARDVMTTIGRGDMDQGSFRFRTRTDNWRMENGETIRDLVEVDLLDVSVVTFPAYEDTTATVRSIGELVGLDVDRLAGLMVRVKHRLAIGPEDRKFLGEVVAAISKAQAEFPLSPALESMRRRLAIADRE